ncbi:uncharacterized protein BDR25DRAFT_360943 [Lindgomyces ingoldianus]|uniref:Uncharacterized protein n=1 Tax=Lindgomyces ingoldianus TaxID=673940 RepID=A0ACB6QFX6_9PLEO|nr:uncharacterized protein BDR25DRAFT_360943 [Lindgomyces ingoldianus]KAF2465036.1 hypothetical protein BDR25DRAFT_360943 [Lindgomyces ingoldianus]
MAPLLPLQLANLLKFAAPLTCNADPARLSQAPQHPADSHGPSSPSSLGPFRNALSDAPLGADSHRTLSNLPYSYGGTRRLNGRHAARPSACWPRRAPIDERRGLAAIDWSSSCLAPVSEEDTTSATCSVQRSSHSVQASDPHAQNGVKPVGEKGEARPWLQILNHRPTSTHPYEHSLIALSGPSRPATSILTLHAAQLVPSSRRLTSTASMRSCNQHGGSAASVESFGLLPHAASPPMASKAKIGLQRNAQSRCGIGFIWQPRLNDFRALSADDVGTRFWAVSTLVFTSLGGFLDFITGLILPETLRLPEPQTTDMFNVYYPKESRRRTRRMPRSLRYCACDAGCQSWMGSQSCLQRHRQVPRHSNPSFFAASHDLPYHAKIFQVPEHKDASRLKKVSIAHRINQIRLHLPLTCIPLSSSRSPVYHRLCPALAGSPHHPPAPVSCSHAIKTLVGSNACRKVSENQCYFRREQFSRASSHSYQDSKVANLEKMTRIIVASKDDFPVPASPIMISHWQWNGPSDTTVSQAETKMRLIITHFDVAFLSYAALLCVSALPIRYPHRHALFFRQLGEQKASCYSDMKLYYSSIAILMGVCPLHLNSRKSLKHKRERICLIDCLASDPTLPCLMRTQELERSETPRTMNDGLLTTIAPSWTSFIPHGPSIIQHASLAGLRRHSPSGFDEVFGNACNSAYIILANIEKPLVTLLSSDPLLGLAVNFQASTALLSVLHVLLAKKKPTSSTRGARPMPPQLGKLELELPSVALTHSWPSQNKIQLRLLFTSSDEKHRRCMTRAKIHSSLDRSQSASPRFLTCLPRDLESSASTKTNSQRFGTIELKYFSSLCSPRRRMELNIISKKMSALLAVYHLCFITRGEIETI